MPTISYETNPEKIKSVISHILKHQAFQVTSVSAKPEYHFHNQNYETSSMYATEKQGNYRIICIVPEWTKEEFINLNKKYCQHIENLMTTYDWKNQLSKKPVNNYQFHNRSFNNYDEYKKLQTQFFKKFPYALSTGLTLVINDKDITNVNTSGTIDQTNIFDNNSENSSEKNLTDCLPIRIAATFPNNMLTNKQENLAYKVPYQTFVNLLKALPNCQQNPADILDLMNDYQCQDIKSCFIFVSNRYNYQLYPLNNLDSHFEQLVTVSLIVSHKINSIEMLNDLSINISNRNTLAMYQPLQKYNPELFDSINNIQNVQTNISFNDPVIRTFPQNFETLLKQTDDIDYSLYYHNQHYYRITTKDIQQIDINKEE